MMKDKVCLSVCNYDVPKKVFNCKTSEQIRLVFGHRIWVKVIELEIKTKTNNSYVTFNSFVILQD